LSIGMMAAYLEKINIQEAILSDCITLVFMAQMST